MIVISGGERMWEGRWMILEQTFAGLSLLQMKGPRGLEQQSVARVKETLTWLKVQDAKEHRECGKGPGS